MAGPSYTALATLTADIAASCAVSQAAFTFLGSQEEAKREGPPRVVWVPVSAKYESATQDEDDQSKVCCQRVIRCEVTITATDFDHFLTLADDFTSAVFRTQTPLSVRILEEDYSRTGVADHSRFQGVLVVEVDIPIRHEEYTSETVLTASQTGTVTD